MEFCKAKNAQKVEFYIKCAVAPSTRPKSTYSVATFSHITFFCHSLIFNNNAKGNAFIATYERLLFLEIDSQSYRVVSHHRSIAILRQWVFSVLDYCYISRSSSVLLHYWVVVLTHWNNVQKWLIVPVRRTNIGIGNKELLLQTRDK